MSTIKQLFIDAFKDGDKGSFGRLASIPFLLTAWSAGTYYAFELVTSPSVETDEVLALVWKMALIAATIYGGSKTLSTINAVGRGNNGR